MFLGIIIMIGYIASIFSEKTKIPESLFMIIIGLLIGPIFKLVDPQVFMAFSGTFATIAIVIILINSGLDFDVTAMFKKMFDAAVFTILVNGLITVSVGIFMHYAFGWNILHGLLLGIVSSGTTTMMVQTLIEGIKINNETRHLLVLESILNDTTLIVISITLIEIIKKDSADIAANVLGIAKGFFAQFSIAFLFAAIFFFIWVETVNKIPPERKKDYVFVIGLLFLLYGIAELFGGSGVISVLVFSLLLGNINSIQKLFSLKERYNTNEHVKALKSIRLIQTDFSFFIKAFFFVFLGIVTDFSLFNYSLLIKVSSIVLLMVICRYVSAKTIGLFNKNYKEDHFIISTMVPRGFVATLLAFLPYNEGITIPYFTEIVLLLIFATAIVSIAGTIMHGIKHHTH